MARDRAYCDRKAALREKCEEKKEKKEGKKGRKKRKKDKMDIKWEKK